MSDDNANYLTCVLYRKAIHNFKREEQGKSTGGNYSLLSRWQLVRGIWLMMYYRVTGKVKVRM